MSGVDPDEQSGVLAAQSLAAGDPTGWFERLYAAAGAGEAVVPWDRDTPNPLLVDWVQARRPDGNGRSALVVGSGLGRDAEYIAKFGFDTVAFDVSPTAIRATQARFPDSPVRYVVADLFDLPTDWHNAFDLVVESMTVQALPDPPRGEAIRNIAGLVGADGTLIVIAFAHNGQIDADEGPPWPLRRAEIDAFASDGLQPVRVEEIPDAAQPAVHRWRAEFRLSSPI
jgi:SAM-dependent methyltransferase